MRFGAVGTCSQSLPSGFVYILGFDRPIFAFVAFALSGFGRISQFVNVRFLDSASLARAVALMIPDAEATQSITSLALLIGTTDLLDYCIYVSACSGVDHSLFSELKFEPLSSRGWCTSMFYSLLVLFILYFCRVSSSCWEPLCPFGSAIECVYLKSESNRLILGDFSYRRFMFVFY